MEATTWQEFINNVLSIVLPAALTVVSLVVIWGVNVLKNYLNSKTNNELIHYSVNRYNDAIKMIVKEAEQQIRPRLADGKLDANEKAEIKAWVIGRLNQIVPDVTKDVVLKAVKNVEAYTTSKIEEEVVNLKIEKGCEFVKGELVTGTGNGSVQL